MNKVMGWFKMLWDNLTGEKPSYEITCTSEKIDLWNEIYQGKSSWLDYQYTTISGQKSRKRLSLNSAKVICSELASLLFSESPEVSGGEYIDQLIKNGKVFDNLRRYSEYMAALGGMAVKINVKNGFPVFEYYTALNFLPISWDNTGITEAKFISEFTRDNKKYLHIEGRYIGKVTNELYQSINGQYKKISLEMIFPDLEKEVNVDPEIKTFCYFGTPAANNFDYNSPLSISTFANAIDTIQALDIAFDGLNSEIVLGKKRIIVPAASIRTTIDSTGKPRRYFDPSEEIYQAIDLEDVENAKIMDNTVELRIEEIKMAIQTLLDLLAIQCGLSAGYLSFDNGAMKTATEVISDNSATFKTRRDYQNVYDAGLKTLFESVNKIIGVNEEISILWDDSVIEDRNSKLAYWAGKVASGLSPKYKAIMALEKVTEDEAKKIVQEIELESQIVDGGLSLI